MGEPPGKKPRANRPGVVPCAGQLVELHRGSYVSQSALVDVLRHVRDHGLPESYSRAAQVRAHEAACTEETPYGPVVRDLRFPTRDGRGLEFGVQAPAPLLHCLVRKCTPVRDLMRETLQQHPSSPQSMWRIVVYFDGISPQNPLYKGKDNRAVEAIYWSFLEFAPLLWDEDLWMCVSAARKTEVQRLAAGMSENIAETMVRLFFDAERFHFERHSLTLDMSRDGDASDPVTVWARHD